jgi:hypothetical protein
MSTATTAYQKLSTEIETAGAHLVAVSKTKPIADIMALYELGQRDFGENRVSELVEKYEALPKDIRWHFIGHLQRNKVKAIAPFVHLIHAVDSLRLLREIEKQAAAVGREVPVLLQFHIAREESKYGLDVAKAATIMDEVAATPLPHVRISGVMGMATYTDDETQVAEEFASLADVKEKLTAKYFAGADGFREISMGMSGDYRLALKAGSTMVRIGSMLFGAR